MACLPSNTSSGASRAISLRNTFAASSGSIARGTVDEDGAIGAHGQRGAQLCLDLGRADRHDDDFIDEAFFPQAQRLFEGDLVEGIDALLDAIGDDASVIRAERGCGCCSPPRA